MHYDLVTSLQTMFPWLEYIVRVGWTEDGGQVWAQVLDRSQQRLELILIPESQFERSSLPKLGSSFESNGPGSPGYGGPAGSEAAPAPIQVITSEQSEWWVSVHDILKFLPHPDPGQVKFLWASEETGYRHLYLVVASVATPAGSGTGDTAHLCPRIVSRVALTSGDWEVVNRQVWWDEKHQMVYFHALRDSCLERHLYCVSVNRPGEVSAARCWPRQLSVAMQVRRLTAPGFSHTVEMSADCLMMSTVFSSVNSLPGCQVFALSHTDNTVDGVTLSSSGWILQPNNPDKEFPPPELFSHCLASGHKLYGMIYKPHNAVPGVRWATRATWRGVSRAPCLQVPRGAERVRGARAATSHKQLQGAAGAAEPPAGQPGLRRGLRGQQGQPAPGRRLGGLAPGPPGPGGAD